MNVEPHSCQLKARRDDLAVATVFVETFCEGHGVSPADQMRMMLAVEELFTNTVTHGHGGGCDAPVRIALAVDARHLTLHYEDHAPPFDPVRFVQVAAPDPHTLVTDREPGGYGLPLVAEMAEEFCYEFAAGVNRVLLRLKRTA